MVIINYNTYSALLVSFLLHLSLKICVCTQYITTSLGSSAITRCQPMQDGARRGGSRDRGPPRST